MAKDRTNNTTISNLLEPEAPSESAPGQKNEIEYYEMDGFEEAELYNKGGFHPVHIGDVLDGRFEVVHKLGHGGFGIVWLCQDIKNICWRAVKIMTADHSSEGNDAKIIDHLMRNSSLKQLRDNHIAMPLEQFWIEGPNGQHLCCVSEVLGWDAGTWSLALNPIEDTTAPTIKNACRQITKGLRFLHGKGVCHGDFRPLNILMRLEGLDKLTKDEVLQLTGEPQRADIDTISGEDPHPHAPKYCVMDMDPFWCKSLSTNSVAIIDFGEAFLAETPPKTTGIPTPFAAPEVLFEGVPGFASDVWSLACTLYEIKTKRPLFCPLWGSSIDRIMAEMSKYLGPVPESYRAIYRKQLRASFGRSPKDGDDAAKDTKPSTDSKPSTAADQPPAPSGPDALEASLGRERQYHREVPNSEDLPPEEQEETIKYHYPQDEVKSLADLLWRMLKYEPSERITIDEVFYHPWLGGPPAHVALCNRFKRIPAGVYLGLSVSLLLGVALSWALHSGTEPSPLRAITLKFQPGKASFPVSSRWLVPVHCTCELVDINDF